MASLGELFVTVGANIEGFKSAMTSVSDELGKVDKEATKATAGFDALSTKLTTMGVGLTAAVTAPIVGLAYAVANVAGTFEQTQTAFTNFLGSAEKANTFLQQLKDFAAKTPFEFPGLIDAAKRMMAFGFASEEVIPILTIIGDAVAGVGAGAEGINRVTLALGQMQAKGKVSAQEMNQLAELGIPAWKMLADSIGISIPEAMKRAEAGAISASIAIPAILDGMNTKFGGLMAKQAQTLLGVWSNLKDQITFTLMDLGTVLLPIFKQMLDVALPMVAAVKGMATQFAALPGPVQSAVLGLIAFAAAAGPLLVVTGSIIRAITTIATVVPLMMTALSGLAGAFSSVTTALQFGMVGALTAAETALLAVSVAAAGVAGVFIGWQIGTWAYNNIPAVQKLGDTIAEMALIQIPYLENALMRLTGVTSAQKQASGDLDFATGKLEASLKAHGITVDRGTMSAEQYAAALRKKAGEISGVETNTDKLTTSQKKTNTGMDDGKKAAEALQKAYSKLGLKNLQEEAEDLSKAIDLLKKSGDWNKLSVDQQKEAMDKYEKAAFLASGKTYDFSQEILKLSTSFNIAFTPAEALRMELDGMSTEMQTLSSDIRGLPMGSINQAWIDQTASIAKTSGEVVILTDAYKTLGIDAKADLDKVALEAAKARDVVLGSDTATDFEKKTAIYKALKAQVEAAIAAGETIPAEQAKLLKKMEDDLSGSNGLSKVKSQWDTLAEDIGQSISGASRAMIDSLWEGDRSFGKIGLQLLKDLGKSVTDAFIKPAVDAVSGFITNTLEGLLKPAIDKAQGWFAGLGKSAADALGGGTAGSAAGAGGSIPGTGGGGGGGGAASAASGVMGWVNLITGAITAISSVIQNFQLMKMETSLNAIEESTRYTKIDIGNLLPKLTNDFASALPGIHDRLVEFRTVGIGVFPQEGSWNITSTALDDVAAATAVVATATVIAAEELISISDDLQVPSPIPEVGDRDWEAGRDADERIRDTSRDADERIRDTSRDTDERIRDTSRDADERIRDTSRDADDRIRDTWAVADGRIRAAWIAAENRVYAGNRTFAASLAMNQTDAVEPPLLIRAAEQVFQDMAQSLLWIQNSIQTLMPMLENALRFVLPSIHARLAELRIMGIGVYPQPGIKDGIWDASVLADWAKQSIGGFLPANIGSQLASMMPGQTVTVTVQGNVIGNDDFASDMADLIAGKLSLQGAT